MFYTEKKDRATDQLQTPIIALYCPILSPSHFPLDTLHPKQYSHSKQPPTPFPAILPTLVHRSKYDPIAQRHRLNKDDEGKPEVRLDDADEHVQDEHVQDEGSPPEDACDEEADAGERDAEHGDGEEEKDVAEAEAEARMVRPVERRRRGMEVVAVGVLGAGV